MAHTSRRAIAAAALVTTSALILQTGAAAGTPGSTGHRDHPERAVGQAVRQPEVGLASSAWSVQDDPQSMRVRTSYPRSTPPESYDGKPIDVQVMLSDGSWETVGTAAQEQVGDKPRTTATVEFGWPESGRLRIRARSHPEGGTYTSQRALVDVREQEAPFDPTALPKTGGHCGGSSIGGLSRIVYECGLYYSKSFVAAYDHRTGDRRIITRRADDPILAENAGVALTNATLKNGAIYRAQRTDLEAGDSDWLARKRNGNRVRESYAGGISGNGRRAVYSSAARGIVRNAPNGENVYLKRVGARHSRLVGHGYSATISRDGRFVAWLTGSGKKERIRRKNLETGRTVTVPGTRPRGYRGALSLSRHGRHIAFTENLKGFRDRVHVYDVREDEFTRVGRGDSPSISGDGDLVAYRAEYDTALYAWTRGNGSSTLVTVGQDGNGADDASVDPPDLSANGRWLLAAADSAHVAPDNGRARYDGRNDIVLFDLAELGD